MDTYKNIDYSVFNLETIGNGTEIDQERKSASALRLSDNATSENVLLLQRASNYWNALKDFRDRRERNRKYYRGDQWGDKVFDPDTNALVTEEDLIKSHGKVPLKQNQIRQLIKNLLGQYLTDTTKTAVIARKRSDAQAGEMLTNTVQYGLQINRSRELDTRNFEEFLLSGSAIWKNSYRFIDKFQREDVWLENRSVTQMFFTPNLRDIRMTDLDFCGEFHDMYKKDIVASFSNDEAQAQKIMDMYAQVQDVNIVSGNSGDTLNSHFAEQLSFYTPIEPDKGRVFEIWERKCGWRLRCHDWQNARYYIAGVESQKEIDNENMLRLNDAAAQGIDPRVVPLITYEKRYQRYWYVKYLTWQGFVLHEQETPYDHKEHPYTVLLYPLVDGEVWGFVEDIIDQQRYVNRLVTLLDFIIGSSAKGVLLVPEDSVSDDFDLNRIADEWTKFNGVIKIKLKPGAQAPHQISANSSGVGINELLSLQLRFMSEISGVSSAIQGQKSGAGTPASLYAQETQNSTLNSKDYFEAYNAARRERDWKMLKLQVQYYDEERQLALAGSLYNEETLVYNPQKAQDVEFEMVMGRSPDSPIYRGIIEENLKEFVMAQLIDFETYLKNSSLPFADNLLNDLQMKKQQALAGGGVPSMNDPNLMAQIGQQLQSQGADASQANPQTMDRLNKFMKGADQLN